MARKIKKRVQVRVGVLCGAAVALVISGCGGGSGGPGAPGAGSRIVFSSDSVAGNFEVWAMNPDGSNLTNLTNNPAFDRNADVSRDGRKIVFDSNRDGNDEIYIMNADGSGQTRLTNNPALDSSPAFSPDGTKIAFNSSIGGDQGVYVMNADGTGLRRLTQFGGTAAWSPDGSKIVFSGAPGVGPRNTAGQRAGQPRDNGAVIAFVYVVDAAGGTPVRVSDTTGAISPEYSLDGSKIVFVSVREGRGMINIMNADGSNLRELTVGDQPTFSPDGRKIAFSRDGDIFTMNIDGTGITQVHTDPDITKQGASWR